MADPWLVEVLKGEGSRANSSVTAAAHLYYGLQGALVTRSCRPERLKSRENTQSVRAHRAANPAMLG